jgi:hypothetical protein
LCRLTNVPPKHELLLSVQVVTSCYLTFKSIEFRRYVHGNSTAYANATRSLDGFYINGSITTHDNTTIIYQELNHYTYSIPTTVVASLMILMSSATVPIGVLSPHRVKRWMWILLLTAALSSLTTAFVILGIQTASLVSSTRGVWYISGSASALLMRDLISVAWASIALCLAVCLLVVLWVVGIFPQPTKALPDGTGIYFAKQGATGDYRNFALIIPLFVGAKMPL